MFYENLEEKLNSLIKKADFDEDAKLQLRSIATNLANVKHTDEEGIDGLYYQQGYPASNKDPNAKYANAKGRGIYGNLGLYDEIATGEPSWDKGINNIAQSLTAGKFEIELNDYTDEDELELARMQQEFLYEALFNPSNGWKQFIREWLESLKYGFSIWEVVFNKDITIKKYAYRRQNTVYRWLLDEYERDLLAVSFMGQAGNNYELSAEDIMLYSHEKTGIDFEGNSLVRKVAAYIEIKKFLIKIYAASNEFNGTGVKVYKGTGDATDNSRVVNVLKRSTATTNSIVTIGSEENIEFISGNGNIPAVESMIRYCDEAIAKVFDNEGSLLGLNNVGSYAMASEASKKFASAAQYYGDLICDLFNGSEPYNNLIKKIIDAKFHGNPLKNYPKMVFKIVENNEVDVDKLQMYINAGLPLTLDDVNMLRKTYGMSPIIRDDSDTRIIIGVGAQGLDVTDNKTIQREQNIPFEQSPQKAPESLSNHICGHNHNHTINLALNEEQEALRLFWERSEDKMAKELYEASKYVRKSWVERLSNATTYGDIEALNQNIYNEVYPQVKEVIKPVIREAVLKGGASLLKDLGAIKTLPAIKAVETLQKTQSEQWVDYEASRIVNHQLNVLLSKLEDQAIRDFQAGALTKNPEIPTEESIKKIIQSYTGNSFNFGRNEAMLEIKAAAEAQGVTTPIVAEYSSVLERNTCGPCRDADGTRVFVGSQKYIKMSPPALCDGGSRCRCIWNIILPEEKGYEQIIDELSKGFSKAESTLLSNNLEGSFIADLQNLI